MPKKNIETILLIYGLSLNENSLDSGGMKKIQRAAPGAKIIIIRNQEDWEKQSEKFLKRVEVVFGRVRASWLSKMPNLRWIQLTSAGANRLLLDAPDIPQSNLILTNTRGTHANQISEHILALMLIFARDLHRGMRRQLNHEWDRNSKTVELEGSTMGLIGVGKIGGKTAEKAKALNMRVLGLRRNPGRLNPVCRKPASISIRPENDQCGGPKRGVLRPHIELNPKNYWRDRNEN